MRLTNKYKIKITDGNSLKEVFSTRISALDIIVASILTIAALIIIFSCIILYTPLKGVLPENIDSDLKKQITEQAMVIDSLTDVAKKQEIYLKSVKKVISGDVKADSIPF